MFGNLWLCLDNLRVHPYASAQMSGVVINSDNITKPLPEPLLYQWKMPSQVIYAVNLIGNVYIKEIALEFIVCNAATWVQWRMNQFSST